MQLRGGSGGRGGTSREQTKRLHHHPSANTLIHMENTYDETGASRGGKPLFAAFTLRTVPAPYGPESDAPRVALN